MVRLAPMPKEDGSFRTFWPFPEAFWVDDRITAFPPRHARPLLHYVRDPQYPTIPSTHPIDTYLLPGNMIFSQELLSTPPGTSWPVFVNDSWKTPGLGGAIGVLHHDTTGHIQLRMYGYDFPTVLSMQGRHSLLPLKGRITWLVLDSPLTVEPPISLSPPPFYRGIL